VRWLRGSEEVRQAIAERDGKISIIQQTSSEPDVPEHASDDQASAGLRRVWWFDRI